MLVYSKTFQSFLAKCQRILRGILQDELGLVVHRKRFEWKRRIIPFHLVLFEHKDQLGYFDPHYFQIGLNKYFITWPDESMVRHILRHELAHFILYLEGQPNYAHHGHEFKEFCRQQNWPSEVAQATTKLLSEHSAPTSLILKQQQVLSKVQKLFKLTDSPNLHEAQLATQKANQLLWKYNLEQISILEQDDLVFAQKVLFSKRMNAKLQSIYDILQKFSVNVVINYGQGQVALEVIGDKLNVELTDYIAKFLDSKLEDLWKKDKLKYKLKGHKAKNSYFRGMAKGFSQKMEPTSVSKSQFALIKKQLELQLSVVYPKMGSIRYQSGKDDYYSHLRGQEAGKSLSINPAVKQKSSGNNLLT